MGPFFDNRAGVIWKVLARDRLVNIGIRPSANSTKMKRVERLQNRNGLQSLWDGNSAEDIDARLSKIEKRWWREAWSRNSDCEILTPELRELKHKQWLRVAWVNVVLDEDKKFAISGKQKDNVREETNAVSSTVKISVQNRHQKPLHRLNHQHKEVEVRRGKRISEDGVNLGSSLDSRAKTTWKAFAPNHLCDCWHPPECQFYKSESGCKFGNNCSFAHKQVEGQPSKKPALAKTKDAPQLGCVFQDTEPPESLPILRKSTKVLGSIRRVRFTKAT